MRVNLSHDDTPNLHEQIMILQIHTGLLTAIGALVHMLCFCNAVVYLLSDSSSVVIRLFAIIVAISLLVLSVKSRKIYKGYIIRHLQKIIRKNFYEKIIDDFKGVDPFFLEEEPSYCMLSNDNKTLIIYSLSHDLRGFYYKCDIFKCVKEDFEFEFEINLTDADVPLKIYNHAILTQLRVISRYIESSPSQEGGYERYINKMIRIRAIDDILENIP